MHTFFSEVVWESRRNIEISSIEDILDAAFLSLGVIFNLRKKQLLRPTDRQPSGFVGTSRRPNNPWVAALVLLTIRQALSKTLTSQITSPMDVAPAWKDFRNCLPAKIRVLPIHLGDEPMVASSSWSGAALQPREIPHTQAPRYEGGVSAESCCSHMAP